MMRSIRYFAYILGVGKPETYITELYQLDYLPDSLLRIEYEGYTRHSKVEDEWFWERKTVVIQKKYLVKQNGIVTLIINNIDLFGKE